MKRPNRPPLTSRLLTVCVAATHLAKAATALNVATTFAGRGEPLALLRHSNGDSGGEGTGVGGAATRRGGHLHSRCRTANPYIDPFAWRNDTATPSCPMSLEPGQTEYFAKLHTAIVDGNGPYEGCRNGSSQEHYVQAFAVELECLYAVVIEDRCGALPSRFEERQIAWEKQCLDPHEDLLSAYDLMNAEEKKYFQRLRTAASGRQIYATYFELADYKELACIFMKAVDDECGGLSAPRLLPPRHEGQAAPS